MRKWLRYTAFGFIAALAGAAASAAFHMFGVSLPADTVDVSYADFLSITLTALSLMITVLGIFVAAAGVIGWSTMESKLKSHSVEYFSEQLAKDGPLRKELEQLIVDVASSGIERLKAPQAEETPYND